MCLTRTRNWARTSLPGLVVEDTVDARIACLRPWPLVRLSTYILWRLGASKPVSNTSNTSRRASFASWKRFAGSCPSGLGRMCFCQGSGSGARAGRNHLDHAQLVVVAGKESYSRSYKLMLAVGTWLARVTRSQQIDDQVENPPRRLRAGTFSTRPALTRPLW